MHQEAALLTILQENVGEVLPAEMITEALPLLVVAVCVRVKRNGDGLPQDSEVVQQSLHDGGRPLQDLQVQEDHLVAFVVLHHFEAQPVLVVVYRGVQANAMPTH